MASSIRIYLDNCCLNRPFDDQTQDRVRLESEAVTIIMRKVRSGEWIWVGSDINRIENEDSPDEDRKRDVDSLLMFQHERVMLDEDDISRASTIHALGFDVFDAYHVAAAEKGRCDVLLSADDRLVARASRLQNRLRVSVRNPLAWLIEIEDAAR